MTPPQPSGNTPGLRHLGRGHFAALDGVRGIAILGVMCVHLLPNLSRLGWAASIVGWGIDGVDLFFVLSGFLISGILFDSLGDASYFRKFYARRVLRIFPLYYGLILVLLLLTRPLQIQWHGVQYSLLLYLQNTHFAFPSLPSLYSPYFSIDHLWSLAVEEQFYLLWPLLVFLIRTPRHLIAACLAGMVISYTLRIYALEQQWGFDWVNRNLFCRMDEMLGGAALAMLLRTRFAPLVLRWSSLVFALAVAGEVLLSYHFLSSNTATSINYTLLTFLAAGLLGWCMKPGSLAKRAFEWSVLRWLGKYSYGLYVLHYFLRSGISRLLSGPIQSVFHSDVASKCALVVASFAISIGAAYLSFQLYEKRFLRLKRFFDYDPRPSPAATMPAL